MQRCADVLLKLTPVLAAAWMRCYLSVRFADFINTLNMLYRVSGGSKGGADVRPPPPSDPMPHVSEKGEGQEREGKRGQGRRE